MSERKSFLIDMDGVLVHGKRMVPGADKFIRRLNDENRKYLITTNNPMFTTRDLAHRLQVTGLDIDEDHIFTSALATALFLKNQQPAGGKAFVIGELGLSEAIHAIGYVQTSTNPDFVVLGETFSYNIDQITVAIRLIMDGARFIATNPDANGPSEQGIVPACGAMASLIEKASGASPFFIGKPNPLMMRSALNYLDVHSEDTIMIGDRMDTDVLSGISAGMDTILVLSGVSDEDTIKKFPYRPRFVFPSVAKIIPSAFDELQPEDVL